MEESFYGGKEGGPEEGRADSRQTPRRSEEVGASQTRCEEIVSQKNCCEKAGEKEIRSEEEIARSQEIFSEKACEEENGWEKISCEEGCSQESSG